MILDNRQSIVYVHSNGEHDVNSTGIYHVPKSMVISICRIYITESLL